LNSESNSLFIGIRYPQISLEKLNFAFSRCSRIPNSTFAPNHPSSYSALKPFRLEKKYFFTEKLSLLKYVQLQADFSKLEIIVFEKKFLLSFSAGISFIKSKLFWIKSVVNIE